MTQYSATPALPLLCLLDLNSVLAGSNFRAVWELIEQRVSVLITPYGVHLNLVNCE